MAKENDRVYLALGLHPKTVGMWATQDMGPRNAGWDRFPANESQYLEQLERIHRALPQKVVSWGEIGMDLSHKICGEEKFVQAIREAQMKTFSEQIRVGVEKNYQYKSTVAVRKRKRLKLC